MKLQDLTCNHCGAPLQVPVNANYVTCNHCSAQLVVRRSEHVTFTEQIEKLTETTERLSERIEDLSSQNDVSALDREWELERSNYMVADKHGRRHLPNQGVAVGSGIAIVVFGCLWTAMAVGITSGGPGGGFGIVELAFPLFGVCFIIAGIASSFWQFSKAQQYREAERRYRRRRAELLDENESKRSPAP